MVSASEAREAERQAGKGRARLRQAACAWAEAAEGRALVTETPIWSMWSRPFETWTRVDEELDLDAQQDASSVPPLDCSLLDLLAKFRRGLSYVGVSKTPAVLG